MESDGITATLYSPGYNGKDRIMNRIFALAAVAVLGLGPAAAADAAKPLVFAAASLKGSLDEAAAAFKAESGIEVTISYAASNALAKQIEQGADAALFISADEQWMDYVAEKDLIRADTRIDLLTNELVLVAPASSAVALKIEPSFALAEALGDGKLAMADPDAVPAGKYGKAALTALDVWAAVQPKVARAENVRAALALVSMGEVPLGIVYVTDAKADAGVKMVDVFPASTHDPILYPLALTPKSDEAAARFHAFLQGEAATAIFARAGFGRPAS